MHPTLIPRKQLLANVNGVGNAILVRGNAVGSTLYSGPGAGASATGSAVVADIMDIARQMLAGIKRPLIPALGYVEMHDNIEVLDIESIESEYYLRIPVIDKVGVMARISNVMLEHDISIDAVIQKEAVSASVPIVILTHLAEERQLNKALRAIEALPDVIGPINRIRVEPFNGGVGA